MIMHSQLDIRGVRRETGQHKIKRSMRLLQNVMAVLYNGLPDLREDSQHGYQMQRELTRTPMYMKALPFT